MAITPRRSPFTAPLRKRHRFVSSSPTTNENSTHCHKFAPITRPKQRHISIYTYILAERKRKKKTHKWNRLREQLTLGEDSEDPAGKGIKKIGFFQRSRVAGKGAWEGRERRKRRRLGGGEEGRRQPQSGVFSGVRLVWFGASWRFLWQAQAQFTSIQLVFLLTSDIIIFLYIHFWGNPLNLVERSHNYFL